MFNSSLLTQLLVELLAAAPHVVTDISDIMQEIHSSDATGTKAQNVANNVASLVQVMGATVQGTMQAPGGPVVQPVANTSTTAT